MKCNYPAEYLPAFSPAPLFPCHMMCYYNRTHVRLLQEGFFSDSCQVKVSLYYQHFSAMALQRCSKIRGNALFLLSSFLDMIFVTIKLSRKGVVTDSREPAPCLHNSYNAQVCNIFFRPSIDNVHTLPYYLIISCAFYEFDYRLS